VHAKAPNAQILVLGYPQLFADRPGSSSCVGLLADEMYFLNTLADLLTATIAHAVAQVRAEGVDIRFLNTSQRWREGISHWACDNWTVPWTNGGIISCDSGIGRETPCRASYHPTLEGHRELADLVGVQLRGVSPATAIQRRILDYVATRTPADGRWEVTPEQALDIAERCLDYTAHGGVVGDPCMTDPMLLVTTRDALGAAANDADALARMPTWVQLNFVSSGIKAGILSRNWMDNNPYHQTSPCPVPRSSHPLPNHECDEYPFYSSELGGAWDFYDGFDSESSTRLKMIPDTENGAEGSLLGGMYTACGLTSGTYSGSGGTATIGDRYLTIPVLTPSPSDTPLTFYVC
jgi:hypothetical protein